MLKILTHSGSFPSAKNLRDALTELTNKKILVTSNPRMIRGGKNKIIIRYGSTEPIMGRDTDYNSIEFVELCSNKSRFSRLMNENNIPCPQFYRNDRPNQFPVVIRTVMNSSHGRGIYIAENMREFNDLWSHNYHWTRWYPTDFEIRVHCLVPDRGNIAVARIFRKSGRDTKYPIRTNDKYNFELKNPSKYKKATQMIQSISSLMRDYGGKFFALDMGYSPELKNYIIFEANSAPGLNPNTAMEYAKFLVKQGVI